MDPVMGVRRTIEDNKPLYELILSRSNFNHLCANCPEIDRLLGETDSGMQFYIFPNPQGEISECFRPMPNRQGYFAYVGAPVPLVPPGVADKEFDNLAQQAYDNLENAINNSGRIPIEEETGLGSINLGYVVIKVEKTNDLL